MERSCNSPAPAFGGAACVGMDIADASCYDGNCTEDSGTNSKFAEK